MGAVVGLPVPDSDRQPEAAAVNSGAATPAAVTPAAVPEPVTPEPMAPGGQGGWPLPVKILLAAVVLGFVWSPFLAMLMRLANVNPNLAPTGQPLGSPDLAPPLTPPGAPPADGRRSPVPSP